MRRVWGQVALLASVFALSGCAVNSDEPATFSAVVTAFGKADHADPDSGRCIFGTTPTGPNDLMTVLGDVGSANARATLEVVSVERNSDGTGTCTYAAEFDAIPDNQRSYSITVVSVLPDTNTMAPQHFSEEELRAGAVYQLEAPAAVS